MSSFQSKSGNGFMNPDQLRSPRREAHHQMWHVEWPEVTVDGRDNHYSYTNYPPEQKFSGEELFINRSMISTNPLEADSGIGETYWLYSQSGVESEYESCHCDCKSSHNGEEIVYMSGRTGGLDIGKILRKLKAEGSEQWKRFRKDLKSMVEGRRAASAQWDESIAEAQDLVNRADKADRSYYQNLLDSRRAKRRSALKKWDQQIDGVLDGAIKGGGDTGRLARTIRSVTFTAALTMIEGMIDLGINLISSRHVVEIYGLVLKNNCTYAKCKLNQYEDKIKDDISGLKSGGFLSPGIQKLAADKVFDLFYKLIMKACNRIERAKSKV